MSTDVRLIIAGGRDYWLTKPEFAALDVLHREIGVAEEVCGMQTGADSCGRVWAILNDIPVKDFKADFNKYGPPAGPMRNQRMAEYANALAIFPGNAGTWDMFRQAKRRGLRIYDFRQPGTFKEI